MIQLKKYAYLPLNSNQSLTNDSRMETELLVNKLLEELNDTKGVIRIRKSKKDRQCNDQKKKDKIKNSDLQNIPHKTKDRVSQPLTSVHLYISFDC